MTNSWGVAGDISASLGPELDCCTECWMAAGMKGATSRSMCMDVAVTDCICSCWCCCCSLFYATVPGWSVLLMVGCSCCVTSWHRAGRCCCFCDGAAHSFLYAAKHEAQHDCGICHPPSKCHILCVAQHCMHVGTLGDGR